MFQTSSPLISDRVALQKLISEEINATDDDSNNRRKLWNDLRESLDGLEVSSAPKHVSHTPDYNEVFRSANSNISLAPYPNYFSPFAPLYQNGEIRQMNQLNTAPSPPMNYLFQNFQNQLGKRKPGFAAPENGLLGRNPAAAALNAVAAAAQQSIWNNGHFDINSLAGTPPANFSSNGSYGFFTNSSNSNEHRAPFGGLSNGLSNGMSNVPNSFFDRPNLPPANLAVGSQRQGNMFNGNMNRPQQQQQSAPSHPMNGMGNSNGPFPPPNFAQPPPHGMMR